MQIPIQQQGADWSRLTGATGLFIRSGAGFPELNFPASLTADLTTVTSAARLGIETSSTGTQVGDVHNYLGNTANNPLLTAPQGGFDRTDAAANYGQNIERTT